MTDPTSEVGEDDECSECGGVPQLVEEDSTNPLTGDSWDRYKCDCGHTTVRIPA